MLSEILSIGGGLLSGFLGSSAAEDAAEASAAGIANAQRISQEQAEQARKDAMALYDPALSDYNKAMGMSIDELNSGNVDIQALLSRAYGDSNSLMQQTGTNVASAIMGTPIADWNIPGPVTDRGYTNDPTSQYQPQTIADVATAPTGDTNMGTVVPNPDPVYTPPNTPAPPDNIPEYSTPADPNGIGGESITDSLAEEGLPSGQIYADPNAEYLLPKGVTREAFQQSWDQLKNQQRDVNGTPYTDEQMWFDAAIDAQNAARKTYDANAYMQSLGQGIAPDRGRAQMVPFRNNDQVFQNQQQQTYMAPEDAIPTQTENRLASVANPISFRR